MRKYSKRPLLSLTFMVVASQAQAEVAFHGYGQVVAGTVFSNNRTFPGESQGYSYHADPSFTPNSNFALQATAPLDNSISATAQILATGDNDFQPKFQWAYLKYQLNDTFALKAGRLQLPLYQYSDYQFVGEAYPWVLTPESVYLAQITTYDGLNLSAEKSMGDWYLYLQAIYGSADRAVTTSFSSPSPVTVQEFTKIHNLTGLSLDSSYSDWLSLRAAAVVEELTLTGDSNSANPLSIVQGIVDSLNTNGHADAAKAIDSSNDPTLYYVASAEISRKGWLFIAEYAGLSNLAGASGIAPNITAEYASIGYHFGKLLPLITVGHRNQWLRADKIKSSIPAGPPVVTVPVTINGHTISAPADLVIDGLAENPGIRAKDWFYEFGLRYDLTSTVALKLDFTHYDSHYRTTDFGPAAAAYINPQDANRLLAAVTFSF